MNTAEFRTAVAAYMKRGVRPAEATKPKRECTPREWAAHLRWRKEQHKKTQKRKLKGYHKRRPTSSFIIDRDNHVIAKEVSEKRWFRMPSRYVYSCFDGQIWLLHRYVWQLAYKASPPEVVDHINGDRADCRISNLCASTPYANALNHKSKALPKSGYRGVRQQGKRWIARLGHAVLGDFSTPLEASRAYEKAREAALRRERKNALKQWRIQVSGQSLDFPDVPKDWVTPHEAQIKWGNKTGVYFVKKHEKATVTYVGQTRKGRLATIKAGKHHVAKASDLLTFIEIESERVGLAETHYIRLLKPRDNVKTKYSKEEKLKGRKREQRGLPVGVYRKPSGRYLARSGTTGLTIGRYSTPEKAAEAIRVFEETGEVIVENRRALPDGVSYSANRPTPRKYSATYLNVSLGWFATADDAVTAIEEYKRTGKRSHIRPKKTLPTGVYVRGRKYAAYAEKNTYVGLYATPAQASAARTRFIRQMQRDQTASS